MVEVLSLQLIDKRLVTSGISLTIGYSKDVHKPTGGSRKMTICTNVYTKLLPYFLELYDATTKKEYKIRRIMISHNFILSLFY